MHSTTFITLAISCASAVLAAPAPAKVVSYSTSCTGTVLSPTPQQYICGQEGRLLAKDGYLYTTSNDASTTAEQCYENCVSMAGNEGPCRTFAFNAAEGTCMYFSKSIKSQDFKADPSTGEVYYNNHCWKNHCTTSYFSSPTPMPTSSKASSVKPVKTKTKASSVKTSSAKPAKTSSAKPAKTTSTKAISTAAPSTKVTSTKTKATKTKASSTAAPTTPTKPTTTTSPTSAPTATCAVPNLSNNACTTEKVNLVSSLDVLTYTAYFEGKGLTENPNNPSNTLGLLQTNTQFPASQSACQAVANCANQASLLGLASLALSFDLHFTDGSDGSACGWTCSTYALGNTNTGVFNVKNDSVKAVFGYSGALLPIL